MLNNPINAFDPTGHECEGEEGECENDNGTPINGAGGLSDSSSSSPDHSKDKKDKKDPNWELMKKSGYSDWEIMILQELYSNGGDYAVHGVEYMLTHGIHIKVGSKWTWQHWFHVAGWPDGDDYVVLDPSGNSPTGTPDDYTLSIIIHEAYHIEQGEHLAKTQLGEMQAGQIGLSVFLALGGRFDPNQPWMQDAYNATTVEEYHRAFEGTSYWFNLAILPPEPVSVEEDVPLMPLYP